MCARVFLENVPRVEINLVVFVSEIICTARCPPPLIAFVFFSLQLNAGKALKIPLIATEQYPEKLGRLVKELDVSHACGVFPKTQFSMALPEIMSKINEMGKLESIVLFGLEVIELDPRLLFGRDRCSVRAECLRHLPEIKTNEFCAVARVAAG